MPELTPKIQTKLRYWGIFKNNWNARTHAQNPKKGLLPRKYKSIAEMPERTAKAKKSSAPTEY